MTLQERFEAAREQAARAHALEQEKAAAGKVGERAKQLQELRLAIGNDRGRRDALRSHGFPVAWPDATKAANALAAVHAAFDTGNVGTTEFGKLTKALGKFNEEANEAVSTQVAAALKSFQKDASELKGLRDVEGFTQRVHGLQREAEALAAHDWKRAEPSVLEGLLQKRQALLKLIDPLLHAEVPAGVREFFTAARGDGASLKLLTEEVKQWLDQNGHLNKVRLVLK